MPRISAQADNFNVDLWIRRLCSAWGLYDVCIYCTYIHTYIHTYILYGQQIPDTKTSASLTALRLLSASAVLERSAKFALPAMCLPTDLAPSSGLATREFARAGAR